MYLEVLAAREDFAAAGKQTRERLLSRVDADVVDELVLGLERAQAAAAVEPEADVDALVGRADVLEPDVRDEVVHRDERAAAARAAAHPLTDQLLLDARRRSQVAEQTAACRGAGHVPAGTERRVARRHGDPAGAVVEGERVDRKRRRAAGRVSVARVHVRVDGEADVGQQGGGGPVDGRNAVAEVRVGVAGGRRRQMEHAEARLLLLQLRRLLVLTQKQVMSRVVAVDERRRRSAVVVRQRR